MITLQKATLTPTGKAILRMRVRVIESWAETSNQLAGMCNGPLYASSLPRTSPVNYLEETLKQ